MSFGATRPRALHGTKRHARAAPSASFGSNIRRRAKSDRTTSAIPDVPREIGDGMGRETGGPGQGAGSGEGGKVKGCTSYRGLSRGVGWA